MQPRLVGLFFPQSSPLWLGRKSHYSRTHLFAVDPLWEQLSVAVPPHPRPSGVKELSTLVRIAKLPAAVRARRAGRAAACRPSVLLFPSCSTEGVPQ